MNGTSRQADWLLSPPDIQANGSTLVRHDVDRDGTDDDIFSADLQTPPRIEPSMEQPIRDALNLVGYRIGQRLDDHENSHVYRGQRIATEEQVAIKVLIEQPHDMTSAVRRFRQESRLMMGLRHPNLVKAIGHGNIGAIHYVILELANGWNLRVRTEKKGPLHVAHAAWAAGQTALVLEYLHRHNIVHRDVKPSNLVLTRDGRLKLLDLGLARAPVGVEGSITQLFQDKLLGTPDFIAPEQVLDPHGADSRADIYGLGCTLYYLLTGRPPYPRGSAMEKLLQHQFAEPQPIVELRPETPPGLALICARMMAKLPADRFETAGEVANVLLKWARATAPQNAK